jgi:hypothetical protein
MKVFRDRDVLSIGILLLVCLLTVLVVVTQARGAPITSSQTITLEHGPDGVWLSQAWVMEWQAGREWRASVIYDTWRRSVDGADWSLPYRQMDVSLTWEPEAPGVLPMALTVGRRWRLQDEGQGPAWLYGTATIGW